MTTATLSAPKVAARSLYASSDPEGSGVLYQVPGDPEGVDSLRGSGVALYCPVLFGGCGRALRPHAQRKDRSRRNYFQHVDPCACEGVAGVSAAHHYIQQEVARHLSGLGFETTYEESLRAYGVADIAVLGGDGDPVSTVEVQVSPKVVEELEERDRLYRESVDQVTWLWGEDLSRAAEAFAEDHGFCLRVDVSPDGVMLVCQGFNGHVGEPFPLAETTYSPDVGFRHAQIEQAVQRHSEYVEERRRRDEDVTGFLAGEKSLARKWVTSLEAARAGEFTPWGPGELEALMSHAPLGMQVRHSAKYFLGVLRIPDEGVDLRRRGVCPFSGRPLYVSEAEAVTINSLAGSGEAATLWLAVDQECSDEIHVEGGHYPLAERSARIEVPAHSPIVRTTSAIFAKPIEAPPEAGVDWRSYKNGQTLLAYRVPQNGAGRTRSGKGTWDCGHNKLLHFPSLEPLSSGPVVITDRVDPRLFEKGPHFLQYLRVAPESTWEGTTYCSTRALAKAPTPRGVASRAAYWDAGGGKKQLRRRAGDDLAKLSVVAHEALVALGMKKPGGWVMSDFERAGATKADWEDFPVAWLGDHGWLS